MNRRRFLTGVFAVLAAPLAVAGVFTGSKTYQTSTITPGKNTITEHWIELETTEEKDLKWMIVHHANGKILKYERWPGEKPPWVLVGNFAGVEY